jgi:enoyl-[acyl-carrier protein] reductase I
MQFAGKQGVVLGVANDRSIAWGIAQALDAGGARVAMGYQNERLEGTVRKLGDTLTQPAFCAPCDLSDDDQIDRFFAAVGEAFGGKLDFLVHSVAYAQREDLTGRFVNTSREGYRIAMEVSVYTLVAAARRALPLMKAAGGGSIVTMTYYGAEKVIPNYNVMGVAKAALEASVRYLATDLGVDNVRVNAVSAGPIKTLAARAIGDFNMLLNCFADRAPLRRTITPQEVADASAFLLSDAARGITGEVLYVDSGFNVTAL